ncbi:hypothetical protein ABB02_02089 [Clostridiaceae bacterium JG1575]|nr:hypothetical protein ABB02_02089 [Clostridiaceae bacterium JG1575]
MEERVNQVIEIKDFSFSYGTQEVLKNCNLSVAAGEIVGFLGQNGSGKTTLLNCMAGFMGLQEQITIYGMHPSGNKDSFKKKISFIQDDPVLLDYLTGRQYIDFLLNIEGISKEVGKTELREKLMKLFDMDQGMDHKLLAEFSHGMRKKTQLIGEMLVEKDLLFFDEPTNGLDISSSITLKKIIKTQKAKKDKTVVLSSHNTQFIKDTCDKVFFFHQGRVYPALLNLQTLDLEEEYLKIVQGEKYDDLFESL